MSIILYAWRNLWRNKKRTLITLTAIALNTAILIVTYALMDGFLVHARRSATGIVTGEVQIHAPGYLDDRSLYKYLTDYPQIAAMLNSSKLGFVPRCYGYGLISSGTKSAGVLFWGVKPALERENFSLVQHIAQGKFLQDMPQKQIILGRKLAQALQVTIGSEIILVVQAADGSLGNDIYHVAGIAKALGEGFDRSMGLIHLQDFQELFVLPDKIHEVAVNSKGRLPLTDLLSQSRQIAPHDEIKSWRELLPALSDMINFSDVSILILGIVFFSAAALSILNTMLMATYERVHEFGIMKALGTHPARIIGEVAGEALLLGLLASFIGGILGFSGAYYLQEIGIDTRIFAPASDVTISFGGVAFDPLWKAAISPKVIVWPIIVMWLVCLLASLYPAGVAAGYNPIEAIRHDGF